MMPWMKKSNVRSYSFFLHCACNLTKSLLERDDTHCPHPTMCVDPTTRSHHIYRRHREIDFNTLTSVAHSRSSYGQTRYPIFGGIKLQTHIIGVEESSRCTYLREILQCITIHHSLFKDGLFPKWTDFGHHQGSKRSNSTSNVSTI